MTDLCGTIFEEIYIHFNMSENILYVSISFFNKLISLPRTYCIITWPARTFNFMSENLYIICRPFFFFFFYSLLRLFLHYIVIRGAWKKTRLFWQLKSCKQSYDFIYRMSKVVRKLGTICIFIQSTAYGCCWKTVRAGCSRIHSTTRRGVFIPIVDVIKPRYENSEPSAQLSN